MNATENEYLSNLGNVKLILGNGFDLHCGLHTGYKDFFEYNKQKEDMEKWYRKQEPAILEYTFVHRSPTLNISLFIDSIPVDSSVWMLFFIIKSSTLGLNNWCDVELEIFFSLKRREKAYSGLFFWSLVYKLIKKEVSAENVDHDALVCAAYMIKKYGEDKAKLFFKNLLKELNIFEHLFGVFVANQREEHKKEYSEKAGSFINDFPLNLNGIVSIDSFNYTHLDNNDFPMPFRNINGDENNPIFGIDSSGISADDPIYIFTKTSRRLIQSMSKSNLDRLDVFQNVVIYGHSLNSQDYNFFFPIFDYLELDNASKTTNVIFAFSDHSGATSEEIQKEQMEGISKIITSYDKYIHPERVERRLLDSLSAQGRIIIHKV